MTKLNINTGNISGPLYLHIADTIQRDVFGGKLLPGDQLPSQRDLALRIGVNVSTVTRAYREAEKRGLIAGTVGSGTFIAADALTSVSMVAPEPRAPGLLELGLVTPLSHMEPDISEALARLARRKGNRELLEYTSPEGFPRHREAGAQWAQRFGITTDRDDVTVCSGSQHALTCILTACFSPGDRVATASLTYPGLKSLAAMLGIRLVPLSLDEKGIIPESLEAACRREKISGLYLMPSLQNPTTASMPRKRRDRIASLAEENGLLVIEDDAYQHTSRNSPDPLYSRIPRNTIYIAGISKAFGAGLRVAFVISHGERRNTIREAVLNTTWMTSPLCAEIAAGWITSGMADKIIKEKGIEAEERNRLAASQLKGFRIKSVPGGYFIWLTLPPKLEGSKVESGVRERGVNIFGAERFTVGGVPAPEAIRLSLTGTATREELTAGLKEVKTILTGENFITPVM